ncbi:FKBP-type peptidyl-prolyl cis-trans isomerase [Reichenbachiella agarivorans]|uniref:Peptidyl-prolyl cis-trans isomerase n=1 Tax=Reichenbachiella agarivorans TaxID=2979464 RepID=A0ABY6CP57_9BACT|nr:FKBP-type peptidyl-prolyl cis-trans isomerase [Reichenbachiella agarivorans]UXP31138.1 FKBP-type peptidyl-prolyl cis-trans isomerase [Reichenbachiella agarivorans]
MQKRKMIAGIMVVLAMVTFGCIEESDFEKQQKQSDKEISNYLKENNINAEKSAYGLYYEVLTTNTSGATPKSGDVMLVRYHIKTLDGDSLESILDDTVSFKFNWNSIIPEGINYGISVMKVGEKIRFYLPSYTAYNGFSPEDRAFAPYSNFIVEMELVDAQSESDVFENEIEQIQAYISDQNLDDVIPSSSGLYFKTLEAGDGDTPDTYSQVTLNFKRRYLDGTLIQETTAGKPLVVNMGSDQLVEGFHQGVMKMKKGEKALLIMPSDIAFGSSVQVIPSNLREELFDLGYITTNVRPYSPVLYEVELLDIK